MTPRQIGWRLTWPLVLLSLAAVGWLGARSAPTVSAQPRQVELALLDTLGGRLSAYALSADGRYLFVVERQRLVVYDVRDPYHPTVVGRSARLPLAVYGASGIVALDDLLVVDRTALPGALLIDLRDRRAPALVAELPRASHRSVRHGDLLATIAESSAVDIYDVSHRTAPELLSHIRLGEVLRDIVTAGGKLYVSQERGPPGRESIRIIVLDPETPAAPRRVGHVEDGAPSLVAADGRLYGARDGRLAVFRLRPDGMPLPATEHPLPWGLELTAVERSSAGLLYGTTYPRSVVAMAPLAPGAPHYRRHWPLPRAFTWFGSVVAGRHAFMVEGWLIDPDAPLRPNGPYVTAPLRPVSPGSVTAVALERDAAFAGLSTGLWKAQVRDRGLTHGARVPIGAEWVSEPGLLTVQQVVATRERAYALLDGATDDALVVLGRTGRSQPVQLGRVRLPSREGVSPASLTVSDGWAYAIDAFGALNVIDVSRGGCPQVAARIDVAPMTDVAIEGDRAYVAIGARGDPPSPWSAGLAVLDVSQPRSPRWLAGAETPWPGPTDVVVGPSYAVVTDASGFLRTFELADPDGPAELGRLSLSQIVGEVRDLELRGHRAIVAGRDRLAVIDVSAPATPRLVVTATLPVNVRREVMGTYGGLADLEIADDRLYLAAAGDGLQVLDARPLALPTARPRPSSPSPTPRPTATRPSWFEEARQIYLPRVGRSGPCRTSSRGPFRGPPPID